MRAFKLVVAGVASAAVGIGGSVALAQSGPEPASVAPGLLGVEGAKALAAQVAKPLGTPNGGTLNGIQWQQAGPVTADSVRFVVSYNVACQWVRALSEGRQAEQARAVLGALPTWPVFASSEGAGQLREAAFMLASGRSDGPAAALVQECDAAGERERQYAATIGAVATR